MSGHGLTYEQSRLENNFGLGEQCEPTRFSYHVQLGGDSENPTVEHGVIVRAWFGDGAYDYLLSTERTQIRNPEEALYVLDFGITTVLCWVYGVQRGAPSRAFPEGCESNLHLRVAIPYHGLTALDGAPRMTYVLRLAPE